MHNLDDIQNLLPKLRSPLPLDYISKHIMKLSEFETLEILNDLINQGIVEENNKTYKLKAKK